MIECPKCKNKDEFKEILINTVVESKFKQNENGKFKRLTELEADANVDCEIKFECAKCGEDLTSRHEEFIDNYL